MKTKLISFIALSILICSVAYAGGGASKGTFLLNFKSLKTYNIDARRSYTHPFICHKEFGKYLNSNAVTVNYDIPADASHEKVTATFNGKTIALNAMGVSGSYEFMSDAPGSLAKNFHSAFFQIDLSFKQKKVNFSMQSSNPKIMCLLST